MLPFNRITSYSIRLHDVTSSFILSLFLHNLVRLWRDRADWDKLIVTMLSSPISTLDVDLLEQELTKVRLPLHDTV